MLRSVSGVVALTLVSSGLPSAGATAQPTPSGAVTSPPTWTPSDQVNRTPTGGEPPATAWQPKTKSDLAPASVTCTTWDRPGALPSYPMERHQISDRLELAVNLSNGNVMVVARDLTLKGTGLNLSVDHVYNSQDWATNSFGNWQLNSGPAVGLRIWNGSVELRGPNGYCVQYPENGSGGYTDAPGVGATLQKVEGGKYNLAFHDSQETWQFSASGWLISQSDRNGHTNTVRYTSDGDIASLVDSQGRATAFATSDGKVTAITDPSGFSFGGYTYTDGRLTRFSDRDGKAVSVGYDSDGLLTSITDARGGTYTVGYTDERVTSLTQPITGGTATTAYAYDVDARKTTVTDANGHAAVHEFDDQGRQVKATDALGHAQSRTWTANSDVNTATNALTNSTTYTYDPLNNLIGTQLATGAKNVVGYTDSTHPHLPTQVTDPSGNQITSEYDSNGNTTKIRSTALNADLWNFNHTNGLVRSRTDAKGAVTSYDYDSAGNLTKVTPPAPAKPTSYTYDSLSRVTSVTDGNGVKVDYGYDKVDRVVSVKQGATVLQANTFDANGNLTGTQTSTATRTLAYDPRNQPTKVTRGTESVSYTYDKVGNVKTLLTPTGTATYTYDNADRLTSLADAYSGTTGFGYDNADRRTTTTFPGGAVQTTGYDNAGRQTSITVTKPGGGDLLKAAYRFTKPNGADTDKLQSKTIKGVTTAYTYDGLGRMSKVGNDGYTLDNASNLTAAEGRTYQVNAADQYTKINDTAVAFDGAGNYASTTNPDSSFTYSKTNQVLSGSLGGTKVLDFTSYDTVDQTQLNTVTETPDGGTAVTHVFTRTVFGVSEVVDNGKRSSFTRDTKGLLVGLKDTAGGRYGAITDYQGTVLALVDMGGNLAAEYGYTPYGSVTATGTAAASNPFRYVGAYQLQRRTYLMGYRIYDAGLARFRSPDPTGQETNSYNYAQGDPINNSDPTGAYSVDEFKSDLGTVADVIAIAGVVGGIVGCAVITAGTCLAGAAVGAFYGGALGLGAGAGLVIFG
ncbi:RHS repeat-associated core domain-containing protein [Umezawaea sp. NPDC059074]|uniref:RHS repeat-associated core domain-containing protein n=1 Tax=Umezawaea sp. NPDC059074 TaxID=3346716 RepID=UPI003691C29B